jgi:hypothetical protein
MGTPSYEGKQVYMGLDVHREFFVASCICDGLSLSGAECLGQRRRLSRWY